VKSFQLTGIRQLAMREVPDPKIERPTDVLVRIGAVGVCGSDIHYYITGRIGEEVVEYPFTLGHECAGTVAEVGSRVTHVKVGDRVAIEPAATCGRCDQCLAGRENTCRHNRFLGCPGQAEGALSEYIVMPQENCLKMGDDMDMGEATVSEPLAIGVYAVRQSGLGGLCAGLPTSHKSALPPALSQRERGAQIGIFGMGPIGRTVLLPAMLEGCAAAYCTDKIDERCVAADRARATWVGNPLRDDIVSAILAEAPLGLDVVFECCGQQEALDQAVELLRPGGKLMIIGIPEVDRISFDPGQVRRKEITIVHVRRQCGCAQAALEMVDRHRAEIDAIVTHRFPFSDTKAAFDLVADYRDGVVKAVVELE
jgi:L-iditol 2-dehydrogenase